MKNIEQKAELKFLGFWKKKKRDIEEGRKYEKEEPKLPFFKDRDSGLS